jgi:hypothetical protein
MTNKTIFGTLFILSLLIGAELRADPIDQTSKCLSRGCGAKCVETIYHQMVCWCECPTGGGTIGFQKNSSQNDRFQPDVDYSDDAVSNDLFQQ